MVCDFCGSDHAVANVTTESIPYKNGSLRVPGYESMHCDSCGEDFVTAEQSRANDRSVIAARAAFDGLLTSDQIVGIRERLGLSQADASAAFGGGPNAFYKYERSEVLVSQAMDLLLRLADEFDDVKARILQRIGKAPSAASGSAAWKDISFANVIVLSESHRTLRNVIKRVGDIVPAANDWDTALGYGEQQAYG